MIIPFPMFLITLNPVWARCQEARTVLVPTFIIYPALPNYLWKRLDSVHLPKNCWWLSAAFEHGVPPFTSWSLRSNDKDSLRWVANTSTFTVRSCHVEQHQATFHPSWNGAIDVYWRFIAFYLSHDYSNPQKTDQAIPNWNRHTMS